jgi:hypothetical protein
VTELTCSEPIEKNEADESFALLGMKSLSYADFERLFEDIKYKLAHNKLNIVKFYAK